MTTQYRASPHQRQSFLGKDSQRRIESTTIGVVGLGGGGSHIVQQLAHIGFKNYVIFDDDVISTTNLNRLVGARRSDVENQVQKTAIASRVIRGLVSGAKISCHGRWQNAAECIRGCDIVFGCLDGFNERRELEVACRRYLIPYIDIGMDVRIVGDDPPRMYGQVILSMPGETCMACVGFLSEENLTAEAEAYGHAGGQPQVVWANGLLASSAVGIAVDLVTGWSGGRSVIRYLSYDGNSGTLTPHMRLDYLPAECEHFFETPLGDPVFG